MSYFERMQNDITLLGQLNFRRDKQLFGIKQKDRLHHMYIIGKTGVGKSTLIKNMILQDINADRGCALLDPHGDLVSEIVERIPEHRKNKLIYFNVPDQNLQWGYNPLVFVSPERRPLLASGVMEILKKQWDGRSWGVRMEHLLRNALLTLLEQPHATIADVLRLFTDTSYRKKALGNVTNEHVKNFWFKEFAKYSYRLKAEAVIPVQNKFGGFLSNPTIANILTKNKKMIRMRSVMDDGKFFLVNLAKGQIGEDTANLLGGLILTSLGLAAYSRSDISENSRRPFHIYADEIHNFATLSTASMMSEMRKYACSLTFANQYLLQLDKVIREAIIGNAGTLICFRLGGHDSIFFEKGFCGTCNANDLMKLENFNLYLKMMIDGMPSRSFSALTLNAK